MAFFARPNLDNTQFKQLQGGEPLTLSGQTQIATTTGFTLTDGAGMYIPVIATGASENFVMTYVSGEIVLRASTASGGSTVYTETGATTCTVGGLSAGTTVYNCTLDCVLQCILNPTLNPTLTNPSISSFTLSPTTTLYEVGAVSDVCGITNFNPGSINPQYPPTSSSCRSNGTICYTYNAYGVPVQCITNSPSNIYPFGFHAINAGNNTISATICHLGGVQPYDSSGVAYCSPLAISATTTCTRIITGVYPWYWGKVASGGAASGANRPSACCIKNVITGGTGNKVVAPSTGTILTTFGSTSDDYIWFATPTGSTSKTCWYVDALNSGVIGGAVTPGGNLFPAPETVTGVTTTCWSGQSYKIYISNYQSCATAPMELRNL